jgi:PLAT/LH2 domain
MTTYRIDVYTGQSTPGVAGATDANVFMTLYGSRASSEELRASNGVGRFGLTGLDSVMVQLCDLGDVGRVHVRHDNTGVAPGWFLDRVVVRDEDRGREWTFPCQRWLARHQDDGQIERVIDAA